MELIGLPKFITCPWRQALCGFQTKSEFHEGKAFSLDFLFKLMWERFSERTSLLTVCINDIGLNSRTFPESCCLLLHQLFSSSVMFTLFQCVEELLGERIHSIHWHVTSSSVIFFLLHLYCGEIYIT